MAANPLTPVTALANEPAKADDDIVVGLGLGPEAAARRIRQLQHEAHVLAHEQLDAFARDLNAMAERASEIAGGGEAYPVGARELASRVAEDLQAKAQSLTAIISRGD